MQFVIGIDPGLTGAMCLYNLTTDKVIEVLNTPTSRKNKKKQLNGLLISNKLEEWYKLTTKVVIETQTIMRGKDGTKSAMSTMRNFGYILGILESLDFEVIEVSPITWQSAILKDVIDPGEPIKLKPTKRKSMVLAKDFNPKNDGQSDAICLAMYYKKIKM